MQYALTAPSQFRRQFLRQVVLPIAIVVFGAALLGVFCIGQLARSSDDISTARQANILRSALGELVEQLEAEQRTGDWLTAGQVGSTDGRQVDGQVAKWFVDIFKHDQVLVVGRDGKVIYEARGPGGNQQTIPASILSALAALAGQSSVEPRQYGDIVRIGDVPAAVSVAPIGNDGTASTLLVNVDYIDAAKLEFLSKSRLLDQISYSVDKPAPASDIRSQVLVYTNAEGQVVGYFSWTADLAGLTVLMFMTPICLGLLGVLITVLCLLARSLWMSGTRLNTVLIQLKASEGQAQHLAFHDALTGLANRALFNDRLDQALARVLRGEQVVVLALDLDRFKHVNDTLGHHAGDCLIRDFGSRISGLLRAGDTMARMGGDEFAILLVEPGSIDEIDGVCQRINEAVRQPFDILGNQTAIGVSIGVALAPTHGTDRIELMRKADIALYQAKADGRNCFRYFTTALDETARLRSELETGLRNALRSGTEFFLAYQPEVGTDGQNIVGLEALLRWRHPTRGVLMPNQFIPVAEEAGLMGELGEWVVAEACRTARKWPHLFMAINVSPRQLEVPGFVQRITALVRQSGCLPEQIELEVTEGVLLADGEMSRSSLAALRAEGFRIALDDFGTGYSSLAYLQQFKVDKIKIDRSFTQSIDKGDDATTIIASVVALGRAMGLKVTAEGVENQTQLRFLSAAGCNELQGFLFSKAVPEDKLAELIDGAAEQQRLSA